MIKTKIKTYIQAYGLKTDKISTIAQKLKKTIIRVQKIAILDLQNIVFADNLFTIMLIALQLDKVWCNRKFHAHKLLKWV